MSTETPMRARIAQHLQRIGSAPARRGTARPERPAGEAAPPEPPDPEARVREAGGPDDRASYACSCGLVFDAAVTTSVSCPRCGVDQAW